VSTDLIIPPWGPLIPTESLPWGPLIPTVPRPPLPQTAVIAMGGYPPIDRGGKEVIITSPAHLEEALAGRTGTRIVADAPATVSC
jgi:hypothetical protein